MNNKFDTSSQRFVAISYCPYCGNKISKDSEYCESCGEFLSNIILTYDEILKEINEYKKLQYHNTWLNNLFNRNKNNQGDSLKKKEVIRKKLIIFLVKSRARIVEIKNGIYNEDVYLTYSHKNSILNEIQEYRKSYMKIKESGILDIDYKNNEYFQDSEDILYEISNFNNKFIETKILEYAHLFKNDGIELDHDQKKAVITDDKYNLVVAGAGSGKTEVLITRIAYLTNRVKDRISPEKILVLAFQKKASKEIQERLKKRYGLDIEIRTFHSLGKKILNDFADANGLSRPTLKDELGIEKKRLEFIQKIFNKEISENIQLQNDIINFMKRYGDNDVIKKEGEVSKAEYFEYQRSLRYTTLDGTKVKSESERDIMNFFLSHKLNGENIRILYEYPASWMEYKNEREQIIQPKPDFYFPYFDIYLEHWALNSNNEVPPWFEGKNPTETYIKNMENKKKKFNDNGKILIETFQKDFENGPIEPILKERFLKALNNINPEVKYEIEPLSYEELTKKVWNECREFVKYLPKNISRFIAIAKTYNFSPSHIKLNLESSKWTPKQVYFGKIAVKIFEKYQESLGEDLDFEDMINRATDRLRENESFYHNKYDHILVDEYQDISMQRYELINQLMKKNPSAKLFCVGDDWQSIMGFAGSNLDFFINFEKYFGNHTRTDLTKNYRSVKSIVDTGTIIIKNNKSYLDKKAISNSPETKPIIVYSILHKKDYRNNYYKQMAQHCISKIKEIKEKENIPYSEFMILLRISKLYKLYPEIIKFANESKVPIKEAGFGNCVRLMTVHKSKGLQSKYVFILNVDKDLYGFPCEIENQRIFEPAIGKNDNMREEEERRLFYVALTRAKEGVYIYTQKCVESKFISEIRNLEYVEVNELDYK